MRNLPPSNRRVNIRDDEMLIIIDEPTRVGLIKLIEKQALNMLLGLKLTEDEANAVFDLRYKLD